MPSWCSFSCFFFNLDTRNASLLKKTPPPCFKWSSAVSPLRSYDICRTIQLWWGHQHKPSKSIQESKSWLRVKTPSGWWFGTFFHILGMSSSQLTHIFQRETTNQLLYWEETYLYRKKNACTLVSALSCVTKCFWKTWRWETSWQSRDHIEFPKMAAQKPTLDVDGKTMQKLQTGQQNWE